MGFEFESRSLDLHFCKDRVHNFGDAAGCIQRALKVAERKRNRLMAYVCCRKEFNQVYQEERREKEEKREGHCNIHYASYVPPFLAEFCTGEAPETRKSQLIKRRFGGLMPEIKTMSNADDCRKELSPSE